MAHFKPTPCLTTLPDELLTEVVQWLDVPNLLNARLICRNFARVSRERRLWRNIVEDLHHQQHIQPPPPSFLEGIPTKQLEVLASVPQRVQRSWAPGTSECISARLVRHFCFSTEANPRDDLVEAPGSWTLVPGGKKLIHIFVDHVPSLHIQLLDIDQPPNEPAEVSSLALAKANGDSGWFGEVSLQPNGKGTGVYIAYLYADREDDICCALHVGELLFEAATNKEEGPPIQPGSDKGVSPLGFTPINQITCFARPYHMQLIKQRVVLAFIDERGCLYFFIWDFLRNMGTFIDSLFKTSCPILLNIVDRCLVVTSVENHVVIAYEIPALVPHTSLPRRPSTALAPRLACRLDRNTRFDIHNYVCTDAWPARDYTDATLLFTTLDDMQTNLLQCWMDNTTLKVVVSGIELPPLEGLIPRRLILSCHIGSTHNTTMIATNKGIEVIHSPNPRQPESWGASYQSSLEFSNSRVGPVVIMRDGMFEESNDVVQMFSNWRGGYDLRASFDELTGKVAFSRFQEDGMVWVVDYS